MWVIFPALDVEYSVFWLVKKIQKSPYYFLPYQVQANLTSKIDLLSC